MSRAVDINGRGVRVEGRGVGVGSALPDSAIAHGVASDYDGSQWVADIGPDVSDAQGSPSKITITANNQDINVVRYAHADDDASKTTNLSTSTDPQAIIFVAKNRTPDATFNDSYYVDGGAGNEFTHFAATNSSPDSHRIISNGTDVSGDAVDNNLHVFCLEGTGSTLQLFRDSTSSTILSGSSGYNFLSGLTLGCRGDVATARTLDVDLAEYTVLEAHTQSERDNEINRLIDKYNI